MLAEKLNVSRQSVSKWELGQALPEVDKIIAMSKLFKVTTDELLLEKDICQNYLAILANIKEFIDDDAKVASQAITTMLKGSEIEKSALLMVLLGADYAAKIYKHLTDDEIDLITLKVIGIRLSNISESTKNETLDQFYQICTLYKRRADYSSSEE
jgi:transcriptional regulator with XRE-family HTH domain